MSGASNLSQRGRTVLRWSVRLAVGAVLLVLVGLLIWALQARGMPDLQPWHRSAPKDEFRAKDAVAGFTFADYLKQEDGVFDGLSAWAITPDRADLHVGFNRFIPDGPGDPASFDTNWNRTVELVPPRVSGGVLLIHGLSDGPYSMHSLAEQFLAHDLYVVCLRLPGHGTVPAGLLKVEHPDWTAAVELAARHVAERVGDEAPFYVAGYSCGGALAVQLALEATEDPTLRAPDRLYLFSPAIGITAFARASNWHKVFSWMPWFIKSRWLSIEPEYDPFKYNSFTKNAGAQMWALTNAVQARLEEVASDGLLDELPPILTFQSVVDATIVSADVVNHLYRRLESNGSELVAFDVNDLIYLDGFYTQDPRSSLEAFEADVELPFRFTLVTNKGAGSRDVVARTKPPFSTDVTTLPLDLSWPEQVYSLSHVAMPFAADDPLYGILPGSGDGSNRLRLGQLALRGETQVLTISAAQILRLRSNPFHEYIRDRIEETLAESAGTDDPVR